MSLHDEPSMAISQVDAGAMSTWSDDKKKSFVDIYSKRVEVAQYVLSATAAGLLNYASERSFIGARQSSALEELTRAADTRARVIGGRPLEELNGIVKERVEEFIAGLPKLKKAISIVDPETAKKMDKIEELRKKGQELKDELDEKYARPVALSDVDQDMTVAQFRQYVKDLTKKRRAILEKMQEIGSEGQQLQIQVDKALYKGVPGVNTAFEEAIHSHLERAKALGTLGRRVSEKVLFGDSEAALELLKHFETDEVSVSVDIRAKMQEALNNLKLTKQPKKLSKGSKEA